MGPWESQVRPWGIPGPKTAPRRANMGQDGPQMDPRWPRMAPRWSQDGPKMGPRGPQDGQRWSKMAPRWPKMRAGIIGRGAGEGAGRGTPTLGCPWGRPYRHDLQGLKDKD